MAQLIKLKVKDLVPAKWNYKENDHKTLEALKANIAKNGQLESIIVRELPNNKYEVVNGNHRLEVFKSLEIKEVDAYSLGDISLKEAQRIALETNETRFKSNEDELFRLLDSLVEEFSLENLQETLNFEAFNDFAEANSLTADSLEDISQSTDSLTAGSSDNSLDSDQYSVVVILYGRDKDNYMRIKQMLDVSTDTEVINRLMVEFLTD